MDFEAIDISGDAGIRARGADLKEVFTAAALGMYGLITDIEKVEPEKSIRIELESGSMEGLLVAWLNELIFHFDAHDFIGAEIDITELKEGKIEAVVRGEDFDPERHERRLLIKAATYHNLKFEKKDGLWQADVIFDI